MYCKIWEITLDKLKFFKLFIISFFKEIIKFGNMIDKISSLLTSSSFLLKLIKIFFLYIKKYHVVILLPFSIVSNILCFGINKLEIRVTPLFDLRISSKFELISYY